MHRHGIGIDMDRGVGGDERCTRDILPRVIVNGDAASGLDDGHSRIIRGLMIGCVGRDGRDGDKHAQSGAAHAQEYRADIRTRGQPCLGFFNVCEVVEVGDHDARMPGECIVAPL